MRVVNSNYPETQEPNLTDQDGGRIPGSDRRTKAKDLWFSRKTAIIIVVSFSLLAGLVVLLGLTGVIDSHTVSVWLWMLLGFYFAFGILVVMYRLISNLE